MVLIQPPPFAFTDFSLLVEGEHVGMLVICPWLPGIGILPFSSCLPTGSCGDAPPISLIAF